MDMFKLFQVITFVLAFFTWNLLGQGVLYLILGQRSRDNAIYKLIATISSPVIKLTRLLMPRFIIDAHIGFIAFLLLIALRIGVYMLFYSQGWLPANLTAGPTPAG